MIATIIALCTHITPHITNDNRLHELVCLVGAISLGGTQAQAEDLAGLATSALLLPYRSSRHDFDIHTMAQEIAIAAYSWIDGDIDAANAAIRNVQALAKTLRPGLVYSEYEVAREQAAAALVDDVALVMHGTPRRSRLAAEAGWR